MGTSTENYNFIKPSPEDYFINDQNANIDKIDSLLKKLEKEKEPLIAKKSAFNADYEDNTANIAMNGVASNGTSNTIARGDHVHPTDTTRAAVTHNHDGVYLTATAVQAKIDSHANQTEPHTGHVSHSLATAVNDFLVAGTVGQFVKRTLSEVKSILGLGTAAYKDANDFATVEQGLKADKALPSAVYTPNDVLSKLRTTDGNGSGLDADLLDGKEASEFATIDQGIKADKALPAMAYTASDVLSKLKTVDGNGSGLDADLLDGKEASEYATAEQGTKADNALPSSAYTAGDVLAKLKTVGGSGSELDADLLDGKEASAFATAEQGKKADNAATQTAFDLHLSDALYPHGYPAVINLLPDSGRFMGKINPLSCQSSADFAANNMFLPFNGASKFTSAGKFINDNSTYGGSSGTLTQDVIDLLDKMEYLGVRVEKRYGTEFYIAQTTSGNGTHRSIITEGYLLTYNNYLALTGKYVTSSFWVRVKSGGVLYIWKNSRLLKNGVKQNENIALSSADGWTHIERTWRYENGFDCSFPELSASGAGVVVQIALPFVAPGERGMGIHALPVPTINELSSI